MDAKIIQATAGDVEHSGNIHKVFPNEIDGEAFSSLAIEPQVISRDQICRVRFARTSVEDKSCSFALPTKDLVFTAVTLIQKIPEIRVKDPKTYRICWTPKLGHAICRKITTSVGDVNHGAEITSSVLDIHHNTTYREHYNEYNTWIGNIDALTNWNSKLPSYTVTVPLPVFYRQHGKTLSTISGIRGMLLNPSTKIGHDVVLRRHISQLIRVQIYDSETETWSTVSSNDIMDKIEVESIFLQPPDLTARCLMITKSETSKWKGFAKNDMECIIPFWEWKEMSVIPNDKNKDSVASTVKRTISLKSEVYVGSLCWMSVNTDLENQNCYNVYDSAIISSSCSRGEGRYWDWTQSVEHQRCSEELGITPPVEPLFFHHFDPFSEPIHVVSLKESDTIFEVEVENNNHRIHVFARVFGVMKYVKNEFSVEYTFKVPEEN